MSAQLAHELSLAIFYSIQVAILVGSFFLKDDSRLLRILMLATLGAILLGAVNGRWVNALTLMALYLAYFLVYISMLDREVDRANRPPAGTGADHLPAWARHTTNPNEILNRLGPAANKIGGSTLGVQRGRHRALTAS